ncbi:MAG: hypothetical protein ACJA13_004202 [Paraglaciecola sp.]|jgi:hypothetical protein
MLLFAGQLSDKVYQVTFYFQGRDPIFEVIGDPIIHHSTTHVQHSGYLGSIFTRFKMGNRQQTHAHSMIFYFVRQCFCFLLSMLIQGISMSSSEMYILDHTFTMIGITW